MHVGSKQFDRVIEITDCAPTQFKNSFNIMQLCNVVSKYNLVWAMAIYPPTATFNGEYDGVGNLDEKVIRQAELSKIGRYPTTRSYMPLLWSQPAKTPRALGDPARRIHEIDEHIRMLVVDFLEMIPTDTNDSRIIITNKLGENFKCTNVSGIQSSYNAIAFRKSGVATILDTILIRDDFCSCKTCRSAMTPDEFQNCR